MRVQVSVGLPDGAPCVQNRKINVKSPFLCRWPFAVPAQRRVRTHTRAQPRGQGWAPCLLLRPQHPGIEGSEVVLACREGRVSVLRGAPIRVTAPVTSFTRDTLVPLPGQSPSVSCSPAFRNLRGAPQPSSVLVTSGPACYISLKSLHENVLGENGPVCDTEASPARDTARFSLLRCPPTRGLTLERSESLPPFGGSFRGTLQTWTLWLLPGVSPGAPPGPRSSFPCLCAPRS